MVFISRSNIRHKFVAAAPFLLLVSAGLTPAWGQDRFPPDPARTMQAMFDQMMENSGPMFGRLTDEQLAQLDAIEISPLAEADFGRKVVDEFVKKMRQQGVEVTPRARELAYISKLIPPLQAQMSNGKRYPKIQLMLIDTDSEDAYSVPGGHLLISRGLIERANSEAALVGVLAHELSHLDRGHQLLPLKHAKLAQQPMDFRDSMFLVSLVARPFRPEQESEADKDATIWMMAAGYQPDELARLLVRWSEKQDKNMPWQRFVPGFVKSHPDAGLRAQAVGLIADDNREKYPNALYVGQKNLQRKVPKTEREFR